MAHIEKAATVAFHALLLMLYVIQIQQDAFSSYVYLGGFDKRNVNDGLC